MISPSYFLFNTSSSRTLRAGFTLVELLVSIGIFVLMTILVIAKYGNFDQSVLMTDLAYDIAITLRSAQTYGLSVQGELRGQGQGSNTFNSPYGVHFCADTTCSNISYDDNMHIILFADSNGNKKLGPNETVSVYTLTRNARISALCAGSSPCTGDSSDTLDVTFKRPDPSAIICGQSCNNNIYATISLQQGTNSDTLRTITVQQNGQISVVQ